MAGRAGALTGAGAVASPPGSPERHLSPAPGEPGVRASENEPSLPPSIWVTPPMSSLSTGELPSRETLPAR